MAPDAGDTTARTRKRRLALQARAKEIFRRLKKRYPDAHCELDHRNAFELLCATILSAQCTDARVNLVTPELFQRYPDAESLAMARPEDVEAIIRSTGFFRNKTKSLIGMANAVVERHGGQIPDSMEALRVLPGVGRKTANVILGNAFGINEGVTVDTHVTRLSHLLRLSRNTDAEGIERDLMAALSAARLGPAVAPADISWTPHVHCPAAEVRRVRDRRSLSLGAGLTRRVTRQGESR